MTVVSYLSILNYVINLFLISWSIWVVNSQILAILETGSRVLPLLESPLEADGASKIEKAQVVFDDQFAFYSQRVAPRDIAFQASPGRPRSQGHTTGKLRL